MEAEKFGAFLQARRKELGMTQADLAEKLYVTAKAVSRWERGVGFPDIKLLQPLADALEVSIVELMHGEKIEKELSREEASTLVTDTVQQIETQRQLSWKRKLLLYTGYVLIFAAYMVVHQVAYMRSLEPKWLGIPLVFISVYGLQYGIRALRAILTGTKFQGVSMKEIPMTPKLWAAVAIMFLSLAVLLLSITKLDDHRQLRDFLSVSSLLLFLFGGIYYYDQTKDL